jgi:hypothetical protein
MANMTKIKLGAEKRENSSADTSLDCSTNSGASDTFAKGFQRCLPHRGKYGTLQSSRSDERSQEETAGL